MGQGGAFCGPPSCERCRSCGYGQESDVVVKVDLSKLKVYASPALVVKGEGYAYEGDIGSRCEDCPPGFDAAACHETDAADEIWREMSETQVRAEVDAWRQRVDACREFHVCGEAELACSLPAPLPPTAAAPCHEAPPPVPAVAVGSLAPSDGGAKVGKAVRNACVKGAPEVHSGRGRCRLFYRPRIMRTSLRRRAPCDSKLHGT